MPSIVEVSQGYLAGLTRKSEIYESLLILMREAADRASSSDAVKVASGVLEHLSADYPELNSAARSWSTLARLDSLNNER